MWNKKLFKNYQARFCFGPFFYGGSLTWVCLGGDQGVYKEKLLGWVWPSPVAGARLTVLRLGSGETQECCSWHQMMAHWPLTTPGVPHIYNGQYIICTIHNKFNLSNESSISDVGFPDLISLFCNVQIWSADAARNFWEVNKRKIAHCIDHDKKEIFSNCLWFWDAPIGRDIRTLVFGSESGQSWILARSWAELGGPSQVVIRVKNTWSPSSQQWAASGLTQRLRLSNSLSLSQHSILTSFIFLHQVRVIALSSFSALGLTVSTLWPVLGQQSPQYRAELWRS